MKIRDLIDTLNYVLEIDPDSMIAIDLALPDEYFAQKAALIEMEGILYDIDVEASEATDWNVLIHPIREPVIEQECPKECPVKQTRKTWLDMLEERLEEERKEREEKK